MKDKELAEDLNEIKDKIDQYFEQYLLNKLYYFQI